MFFLPIGKYWSAQAIFDLVTNAQHDLAVKVKVIFCMQASILLRSIS